MRACGSSRPQALSDRPHIEKITTLCRPLHGDDAIWQSLREVVTAIDSRDALSGRLERRDGSVVDCTTVPLPAGATLVTFHDVTDSVNVERALRERNDALEDADRIKVSFVHNVSYELRSPLTNIIGFVHLLGDPATGELAPKQREYLDYITVSSNALLALINNILDLATIDAGRMHLNLETVDIRQTMREAAEGVQDRLVSTGLALDIRAPADIGSFVADGKRLQANPLQPFGQCGELFAGRLDRHVFGRAARRRGGFLGLRQGAGNSARSAGKGLQLVRDQFARLAPSRLRDRPFAGAVVRRTARRHGHHRFGGRRRDHRDLHLPGQPGRRKGRASEYRSTGGLASDPEKWN